MVYDPDEPTAAEAEEYRKRMEWAKRKAAEINARCLNHTLTPQPKP